MRHTGSLFLKGVLDRAGYQRVTLRGHVRARPLVFDHCYERSMRHIHAWARRFGVVVIPLRDPQACAEGWARRGEEFDHFDTMWRGLLSLDEYQPFYVPIDLPCRERRLAALSAYLGVPLYTDWRPVNRSPRPVPAGVPDVSYLYDWPVIRDFYGGDRDALPLHRAG